MFLETSALTGENVEETFLKCARSILTKIESGTVEYADVFLASFLLESRYFFLTWHVFSKLS